MLIKGALTGAAVVAFTGCAFAADVTYYPPTVPQSGSPLYAPTPMAVAGDLSLALGVFWLSGKSGLTDTYMDVRGRLNLPLHNGWNLEPEFRLSHDFGDGTFTTGVLHFYKNLPNGAVGPFVALSGFSGGGPTAVSVGGEVKTYLPNADLTGQISWTGMGSGSGFLQIGGFVDYYLSPMSKLRGGIEVATGSGTTVAEASAQYLRRVYSGPNASGDLFAAGFLDFGGGGPAAGAFEVGGKLNFGPPTQTVRQQDEQIQFTFAPFGYWKNPS